LIIAFFSFTYLLNVLNEVIRNRRRFQDNVAVKLIDSVGSRMLNVYEYFPMWGDNYALPVFRAYCSVAFVIIACIKFFDALETRSSIFSSHPFDERITGLLTIVSALLIFPWHFFGLVANTLSRKFLRKVLRVVLKSLPVFVAIFSLFTFLWIYFESYLRFFVYALTAFGVFSLVWLFSVEHIRRCKDLMYLKKINLGEDLSRKIIESHFLKMRTAYGRMKFVALMYNKNYPKMKGAWTDQRLPNFNDDASTLLAKLESKWLGFER
jgi:hypothetical protein